MRAVRESLLERQGALAGIPLWKVAIPYPCSNEEYERAMAGVVARARAEGARAMAFGDLFLAEIRAYREQQLAGTGIEPVFPLWGRPTDAPGRELVRAGI